MQSNHPLITLALIVGGILTLIGPRACEIINRPNPTGPGADDHPSRGQIFGGANQSLETIAKDKEAHASRNRK